MNLEDRIARLEALLDKQEQKRRALRNQLIALQVTVVNLLPVISICPEDDVRQAMRQACASASRELTAAQYDSIDVFDVISEVEALYGEVLDGAGTPYPRMIPS